jgi:hypothetical protein
MESELVVATVFDVAKATIVAAKLEEGRGRREG